MKLTSLKVLVLIRQVYQKSVLLATIIFLDKGFMFQLALCNWYNTVLTVLMMPMNLNGIAISIIRGADYRFIINGIS